MKLQGVTISGVDDAVDPRMLEKLSARFPFVEWGILVSTERKGTPRYPSTNYIKSLDVFNIQISLHVCGGLAQVTASSINRFICSTLEGLLRVCPRVRRIQINQSQELDKFPRLCKNAYTVLERASQSVRYTQIILQTSDFNHPVIQLPAGTKAITGREDGGVIVLHDASGGRGISGPFQAPINDNYVGFAGGITPENVEEKIREIQAMGGTNPFYIDMESGVRTGDALDLDKVEKVLSLCEKYIGGSNPVTDVASVTAPPKLRAYKITAPTEDRMDVVFAATPGQAKRMPDWACDYDFTELRAVRAPSFDDCQNPPTIMEYLERGWHFFCAWCEKSVYLEEVEAKTAFLFNSQRDIEYIACCEECRDKALEQWAKVPTVEESALPCL